MTYKIKLEELGRHLASWTDKAFGIRDSPSPVLEHLVEEVAEVIAEPYDLSEYADCMNLIVDASRIAGYTPQQLLEACLEKSRICANSEWFPVEGANYFKRVKK